MHRALSLVLVLVVSLGLFSPPAAYAQEDSDTYNEMVAALNAWRVEEGLWPLRPNSTLDALAQSQADYLISLSDLPDDMHAGRLGRDPMERAVIAPYNWPTYGRSDQVAIGEIAYVGFNVAAAITWWQGSSLHTRTIQNDAYREIGVGLAAHPYGTLFIVVLGARPNVLPVEVDAAEGLLYLSNETYTYASRGGEWLFEADQMRLFDADGRPLSDDWQAWQATLPVPAQSGDHLYVMFTDGTHQVLAPVDLRSDLVLLPGTLDQVAALAAGAEVSSAVVVAAPTGTPVPTSAAADVTGADEDTTSDSLPDTATAIPSPTPEPTAMPELAATPDVRLIYNDRSLAAVNVSGASLDVSSLVLQHAGGTLAFTAWDTQWLSGSLTALAARDCLQVWGWDQADQPKPSECRTQRGVITISPSRVFWTTDDFEVYQGATLLATCAAGAGECDITLP